MPSPPTRGALSGRTAPASRLAPLSTTSSQCAPPAALRFVTALNGISPSAGVRLDAGGTSWSTLCDRNAKKNFAPVDSEAVLSKLAALPIQQWHYKWEADDATPNLGPMAQEFKAAFYPGRDDKSITTLEYDGVELSAIQGLNRRLEQKEAEIDELRRQLAELKTVVEQLARPAGN